MLYRQLAVNGALLLALLGAVLATPLLAAAADTSIQVPFTADRWRVQGDAQFVKKEAFPQGLLSLNGDSMKESAALKDLLFGNGTIEFDMKAIGEDMPGIRFRQRDAYTAEEFYIRVGPDCPAAQDCLQYTPVTHGRMLWDTYIQYQKPAPFLENQWNHLKLVISGRRMNVYVNRQSTPSLSVGRLQGDALAGAIELQGPATFANLTVTPNAVEGLSPEPMADPSAGDQRYLRVWELASPTRLAEGGEADAAAIPPASADWTAIQAEANGLINLARRYGANSDRKIPEIAWLKTRLESDRDQTKHVSIGWLREVWVFANGELVYADKNLYNTPGQRKEPDGRLSIDNGSFDLPLHKGVNDVVIAIRSNTPDMSDKYGWGVELRLDDLKGVEMAP